MNKNRITDHSRPAKDLLMAANIDLQPTEKPMDFMSFYLGIVAGACLAMLIFPMLQISKLADEEFDMPHPKTYYHEDGDDQTT